MPVLELTEATTSDVVEPFPAKASQWLKASRVALVSSVLCLMGALALTGWGVHRLAVLKEQLAHPIRTEAEFLKAARIQDELQKRGIPQSLKEGRFLTAAEPVLKSTGAWRLNVGPSTMVTLQFTLSAELDHLDVLTSLDKAFANLGYQQENHATLAHRQYVVAYHR
jgi:hypothetical protein